jgi:antitoxin component HigA of HigAB toxin-antitoxin module
MSQAAEITDIQEYAHLLGDALPHVIHTEAENERCTAVLESMLRKRDRTAEEARLAELLTYLIEEFEGREYERSPGRPDPLKGKRELSKTHIAKLSDRFRISPGLFF